MLLDKDKVITMMSDEVFKSVLQDRSCEDYLVDIIEGITKINKDYIKRNLVFKNSELTKEEIEEKGKITDLLIELQNNIINLEMNKYYYDGLFNKNDRYVSKLKEGMISKKEKFANEKKVIQINFNNFDMFDERVIIKFKMMDPERHLIRSDYMKVTDTEIYYINLKRVREKYYNKEVLTKLEKELLIMTTDNKKELKEISRGYKEMESVAKKISKLSKEEEIQGIYLKEEQEAFIRDQIRAYAMSDGFAEGHGKGLDEGRKEGLKEGIKEGREEGIKEGRKAGREEGKVESKKEIAKNLLKEGVDIKIISSSTGLSKEEIEKL